MRALLNLSDYPHLGFQQFLSTSSTSSASSSEKSSRTAKALIVAYLGYNAIAKTGDIIDVKDASAHMR